MSIKSKAKKEKETPVAVLTDETVLTPDKDVKTLAEKKHPKAVNLREPFDEKKHLNYPKVENASGEILKPIEVITFYGGIEKVVFSNEHDKLRSKLSKLKCSLFGYRQFSVDKELEKPIKNKKLYCFKDKDVTLYLTDDCEVRFVEGGFYGFKPSEPTILVASGLKTSELRIKGINLFMGNGVESLAYVNLSDSITLLGDFDISVNSAGNINRINIPNQTYYKTQGGSFISRSAVFAGRHSSKTDISIEKSIVTCAHFFNTDSLNANQSVLSNVSINTKNMYLTRVSIIGGSINLKSMYVKNVKLVNPAIYSPTSTVSTDHSYGISEIHHPLLPKVMVLVNGEKEVSLKASHFDETITISLTDTVSEIIQKLIGWKDSFSKPMFTETESLELAKLIFSRTTVLRTLSNIENTRRHFNFVNRMHLPILDETNDYDDSWDIGDF